MPSAEQSLKSYISYTSQHTLVNSVNFAGVGIHTGQEVTMSVIPAREDEGIVFVKTTTPTFEEMIPAKWDNVCDTHLCTAIKNSHGHKVQTIEHLMAALSACNIDNARIVIDGDEVPTLDGSSQEFIQAFEQVGVVAQNRQRREIVVLDVIEIRKGDKVVKLSPLHSSSKFTFTADFSHKGLAVQYHDLSLSTDSFKKDIMSARTFGFHDDLMQLKELGFARGGTLQNAILVKDGKVVNEGGLRYPNEFVRHKILDAVGDLYLAGYKIRGHYHGVMAGHAMNNQLLRLMFSDSSTYSFM